MQTTERKPLILQAMDFAELGAFDVPEDATPEQIAELEAEWEEEFASKFTDIQERFTAIRKVIERETFLAEQHDPEINLLKRELELRQAGKAKHEGHVKRVKAYAVKCLELIGDKVEAEGFKFAAQKNSRPSITVENPVNLAPEYQAIVVKPDNDAILAAYKAGETVNGAVVTQGKHLRIRGA